MGKKYSTTRFEVASIIEKIESVDSSIRIAMVSENRQNDPLVQSWLHTMLQISNDLKRLKEDSTERRGKP